MVDRIKVDGLAQFVRDLKKLDSDLPKAVRNALNAAAQLVVDTARPEIPSRSGKAKGSVRVASTRTKVRVRAGGNRAPYYPWLDFGGRVGRRKSVVRPFRKEGRYIYDAYYRKSTSGDVQRVLTDSLLSIVESAGIAVES